jgi:hypothetical protein
MMFGYVPPPFGLLWPDIRRLLNEAVEKGGNDWGEVEAALAAETAQLWLTIPEDDPDFPVAAMVTRMDGNTFEIWLAGGKVLSTSVPYLETALRAAREEGATNARIVGRKGWTRVLKPYGWRVSEDELVKDLVAEPT